MCVLVKNFKQILMSYIKILLRSLKKKIEKEKKAINYGVEFLFYISLYEEIDKIKFALSNLNNLILYYN
jgi:hypothetical protein